MDWPASLSALAKPPRPERRKPMVRLVCPICAAMVTVNALEVAGTTDSRCAKCPDTVITVETDDEARIIGITGYENTEGRAARTGKATDWRLIGMVAVAVVAVMLFLMTFNAARQTESGRPAFNDPSGLASPVKSVAPGPSGKVSPTPPDTSLDMFAPERK